MQWMKNSMKVTYEDTADPYCESMAGLLASAVWVGEGVFVIWLSVILLRSLQLTFSLKRDRSGDALTD